MLVRGSILDILFLLETTKYFFLSISNIIALLPAPIITELIIDTLTNKLNKNEGVYLKDGGGPLLGDLDQDDDGWFSGIFPSYKKKKSPFKKCSG